MPTSPQNYEGFKQWAATASNDELIAQARAYQPEWEVQGVDVWSARELPSAACIEAEAATLSDPGLERLGEQLRELLAVVEAEQQKRIRRGNPSTPDGWMLAIFYFELKKRGLDAEAKRLQSEHPVHHKTLKRYLEEPFR